MDEPIHIGTFRFTTEVHIKPIVEPQSFPIYAQQAQTHPLIWVLLTIVAIGIGYLAFEHFQAKNKLPLAPIPWDYKVPPEDTRHFKVPDWRGS